MKLELYTNTSDAKKIGKDLALVTTLDPIHLKEGTDILHPVFTFHKFKDDEGEWIWKNFNYAKLKWSGFPDADDNPKTELTRCYFVGTLRLMPGGIIEIPCEIDRRETWKDWILAQNFLVSRQENIHDKSIPDDRAVVALTRQVHTTTCGTVGDGGDGTIVLTVSG